MRNLNRIAHIICLLAVVALFFSCNKLRDFLPLPAASSFDKTYGGSGADRAMAIATTFDGGYITAGSTNSTDGDVTGYHSGPYNASWDDFWVVKLDDNGKKQWQKALGGSESDRAMAVATCLDGGYVVVGNTQSTDGDVTGFHGGANDYGDGGDAWIVKLSAAGNIVWQKALGGSREDVATSVTTTRDGGYIIAGYTGSIDGDVHSPDGRDLNAWVVRLDNNGTILWEKTLGGTGVDLAHSIITTADGGYVMAGATSSTDGDLSGYGSRNSYDGWILKLNESGAIVWQQLFGGSSEDRASSVAATSDGGYVVAGNTASTDGDGAGNHGEGDALILKLDNSGKRQWLKLVGTAGSDGASSIVKSANGSCVIVGATNGNDYNLKNTWVFKLDKQGNTVWQQTFGGSGFDAGYGIVTSGRDSYVVAGEKEGSGNDTNEKYDTNVWAFTVNDL